MYWSCTFTDFHLLLLLPRICSESVDFLSSGYVVAVELVGDLAISKLQKEMGLISFPFFVHTRYLFDYNFKVVVFLFSLIVILILQLIPISSSTFDYELVLFSL